MNTGLYFLAPVDDRARWENREVVNNPRQLDQTNATPRGLRLVELYPGEAWGTPTLRLAGTTFDEEK